MYEPVNELYKGDSQLFLETDMVLGEKYGKLLGCHDMNDASAKTYRQSGGVVYKSVQFANNTKLTMSDEYLVHARSLHSRAQRQWSTSFLAELLYIPRQIISLPSRIVDNIVSMAASALPILRFAYPTALLPSPSTLLSSSSWLSNVLAINNEASSCPVLSPSTPTQEAVTAISFHPYLMWLAVVIAESTNNINNSNSKINKSRPARIVVYDVCNEVLLCTLTHAFQCDVRTVVWKPMSRNTLLVGCKSGILVWSLSAGEIPQNVAECLTTRHEEKTHLYLHAMPLDENEYYRSKKKSIGGSSSNGRSWTTCTQQEGLHNTSVIAQAKLSARIDLNKSAWALFYSFPNKHVSVTAIACTHNDGCKVACGSTESVQVAMVDLSVAPIHSHYCSRPFIASIKSGIHSLLFASDDVTLIATYEHASVITLTSIECPSYKNSVRVATTAPVLAIREAVGVGINYYFMQFDKIDGIALAKITPMRGVEIMSIISTSLSRGIGGLVRVMMCSGRRLWLATETNHLIVAQYGAYKGQFTFIPIGVAAMEATHMDSFANCTSGSLLALVERNETVHFIPHYHM